jgi:hypothetical protein
MIRRVCGVVGLTVVTLMVVPIAMALAAGAAPSSPVSVADLVTSSAFSGTVSPQSGVNGCSYDFLTFGGTYPGNTPVGTVNLDVAGCFNSDASSFSGSFTITTGVGGISGNASGPVALTFAGTGEPPVIAPVSDNFELTLSVTAGTGSFAGAAGDLQAVLDTPYNDFASFEGTVTDFFTQVTVPQPGALSGVTYLDAGAYDAPGAAITQVVFELTDGPTGPQVVATATPTIYGWLARWNTSTSVPSGIFDLVSVVTDADGNTATSFPVQIQVDNPLPTTAVVLPSNGTSFSGGSAVLDAAASSPDGAPIASVKFTVTPESEARVIGTATPTIYGYILVWNTTTVPNGTYTLESVVTDVAGNYTYSAGISITVNNSPPTTAVTIPSNGASVSGTSSLLDASASANVTYLTFELSGGTLNDQVIATATLTYYGWLAQWNTRSVPNGTYTLQSVASYSRYFASSGTSAPVTITVAN